MRLTSLHVHPLKSGAARGVPAAQVLSRGLVDDRSWMVVDADGVLVSARTEPRLLTVVADTAATDPDLPTGLRLRCAGRDDLVVATPTGSSVAVRLHRVDLEVVEGPREAHDWIRAVLGRDDVRLVWCDAPAKRQLNPAYSRPGDHTAFADGYPVTIASEGSLRQLNEWVAQEALERGEEVPPALLVDRFRPNLVVEDADPFVEDSWREVEVGEVTFRVAKPVDRCVMTTIDPTTLASGKEPIRSLARHRLSTERKTLFAVHLIPLTPGWIRVGDRASAR